MLSLAFIYTGIEIPISWAFLLIIIVSLILNQINPKFTCLAYVMSLIYVIDAGLVLLGIKEMYFKLSYAEMIYLIGLLHGIEGLLTITLGGNKAVAVVTYRGEEVAGGYQAYGKWLIPLLLFSVKGIYIPIVAAVIYMNESFVLTPKSKAKVMGSLILIYGLTVIFLGYLASNSYIPLWAVILSMPILHECLFLIDNKMEMGKLLYPYPKQGMRVMEYTKKEDSQQARRKQNVKLEGKVSRDGQKQDIEKGDVILQVNGSEVNCEEEYLSALRQGEVKLLIEKLAGDKIEVCYTYEELLAMKLIFLPPL